MLPRMSESPRKLLRRALRALEDVEAVCDAHPEARAQLEEALGRERLAAVDAARRAVADAVAHLPAAGPGAPDDARPGARRREG